MTSHVLDSHDYVLVCHNHMQMANIVHQKWSARGACTYANQTNFNNVLKENNQKVWSSGFQCNDIVCATLHQENIISLENSLEIA